MFAALFSGMSGRVCVKLAFLFLLPFISCLTPTLHNSTFPLCNARVRLALITHFIPSKQMHKQYQAASEVLASQ